MHIAILWNFLLSPTGAWIEYIYLKRMGNIVNIPSIIQKGASISFYTMMAVVTNSPFSHHQRQIFRLGIAGHVHLIEFWNFIIIQCQHVRLQKFLSFMLLQETFSWAIKICLNFTYKKHQPEVYDLKLHLMWMRAQHEIRKLPKILFVKFQR